MKPLNPKLLPSLRFALLPACLAALSMVPAYAKDVISSVDPSPANNNGVVNVPPVSVGDFNVSASNGTYTDPDGNSVPSVDMYLASSGMGEWWVNSSPTDPWNALDDANDQFAYHHREGVESGGFMWAAWSFKFQYEDYTSEWRHTDGQLPNGSIVSFGISNGGVPYPDYPDVDPDDDGESVKEWGINNGGDGKDLTGLRYIGPGLANGGPTVAEFPGVAAFGWQSYEVTGGADGDGPSGQDLNLAIRQPAIPLTDYVVFVRLPAGESLSADGRSFQDLTDNQMEGLGMTDEIVFNWTIDSKNDQVREENPQFGTNIQPDVCTLEFTDGAGGSPLYLVGDSLFIEVEDSAANDDAGVAEQITVTVTNDETGETEAVTLTETGVDTGIFTNTTGFPTTDSGNTGNDDGALNVQFGQTITASSLAGGAGAACTDTYLFPTQADLTKAVDLTNAAPGDELNYTISPRYPGAGILTNVVVTDGVPANTTIVGSPGQGGSHDGGSPGTVTWNLGSVTSASDGLEPGVPGGPGNNYEDDLDPTSYELNSTGGPVSTGENNSSGSTAWSTNWIAQVLENGGDSKVKFADNLEVKSKDGQNGDFAIASRVVPLAGHESAVVQITTTEGVKLAGGSVLFQARYSAAAPWVTLFTFSDNDDETDFGSPVLNTATLGGELTETAEIRFHAISDGGGESKIKLSLVTVDGTIAAEPELTSSISAYPLLLADGDTLTVEVELGANLVGVDGVNPSNFLPNLAGSNGATLTLQSGPAPATADIAAGTTQVFTYTYLVDTDSATAPGSFSFGSQGSGDGGSVTWPGATSNSVLVSPPLTYQVEIGSSFEGVIPNIASISDSSGTIPPTDSNEVKTVVELATLGNYVWLDENGDGIQDAGEDGIPGVIVKLQDENGTPLGSTFTDSNGGYLFSNVPPNVAVTVVVDPTSLPSGLTNQTGDPDASLDGEYTVTLAPGGEDLTADFGYNYAPSTDTDTPPSGALGAIGDRVWNDADSDGIQDAGEAGIGGVEVKLFTDPDADGVYDTLSDTRTTDASGNYVFDDLAPGSYRVEVTPPSGYTQTAGDPDSIIDNATTSPIVLAPGDVFLNADFGYVLDSGAADIGDTIYLDVNGNGTFDLGTDTGIAGVTVVLFDTGANAIATTTTDANGNYLFPGLPSGVGYTIFVNDTNNVLGGLVQTGDPDAALDGGSTVASLSPAGDLDQDFGYAPLGTTPGTGYIGDTIYIDTDDSGDFTAGEGVEGVTVELYDATGTTLITSTVTNDNGTYGFPGLDPNATYVVKVDTTGILSGLTNIEDPQGPADSESLVDLSTGTGIDLDQDFGYAGLNDISGLVWLDPDADGTRVGTETGRFGGVTVDLLDASGNVVAQTTTLPDGSYTFDNVPDGTYTVDVTDDANVLAGYWHSLGSDSAPDPTTVTVNSGNPSSTIDFGYYKELAALGNYVWLDAGEDGIQESGAGVAGVELTLTITYPNGDIITVTTVTDANGNYSFNNLLADEDFNEGSVAGQPVYTIAVTPPLGLIPTLSNQGGNEFLDSNVSGSTALPIQGLNDVTAQDPASGESVAASYDFGLIVKPKSAAFADFLVDNAALFGLDDNSQPGVPATDPLTGATTGSTDTDNDDFGTAGSPNPGLTGNVDGDVYNNLLEFALCFDPGSGTKVFPNGDPNPGFHLELNGSSLDAKFNRPANVLAEGELTYTVQISTDGQTWNDFTGITPTIVPGPVSGSETVCYEGLDTSTPGLLRLEVSAGTGGATTTSVTGPVGWQMATIKDFCQTYADPLLEPCLVTGTITGVSGQVLDLSQAAGTQALTVRLEAGKDYYLEVMSGDQAGHRFDIESFTDDSITLAADSDLCGLSAPFNTRLDVPADLAGDSFVIREHKTLDKLFPIDDVDTGGIVEGFTAGTNATNAGVLLRFDRTTGGLQTYIANSVAGPDGESWEASAPGSSSIMPPGEGIFVHNLLGAAEFDILQYGEVRTNQAAVPLCEDFNFVAPTHPIVAQSIDGGDSTSRLMNADNTDGKFVFEGSGARSLADQVQFWDDDNITTDASDIHLCYQMIFYLRNSSGSVDQWSIGGTPAATNEEVKGLFDPTRSAMYDIQEDDMPDYYIPSPISNAVN